MMKSRFGLMPNKKSRSKRIGTGFFIINYLLLKNDLSPDFSAGKSSRMNIHII